MPKEEKKKEGKKEETVAPLFIIYRKQTLKYDFFIFFFNKYQCSREYLEGERERL